MMTVEEIGRKMDALGAWDAIMRCHWVLKPRGSAFPYFAATVKDACPTVKVRFLLLEGWQTFHDYLQFNISPDIGFYSTPSEMPHFELIVLTSGAMKLYRNDPGYVPQQADAKGRERCVRMLWESYGMMLRLESDSRLPLSFADQKALFGRVEDEKGNWHDEPIEIPPMRPHVEKMSLTKKSVSEAKDLPMKKDEVLEIDLILAPAMKTREKRPRSIYLLAAVNPALGEVVFAEQTPCDPETGLRGLWEGLPQRVLNHLIARRVIPGEIRVQSGRVFRMLRPLCLELPFRLSKVNSFTKGDAK